MGGHKAHEYIDDDTQDFIRSRARRLADSDGFSRADCKDIEQDITLDLLQRLPKFDRERGHPRAFVSRVVDNKIADLIQRRKARKRDYRRERYSLNEPVEGAHGNLAERGDLLDPEALVDPGLMIGRSRDLYIDLGRAIYGLPPDLAALCDRLRYENVTEIARDTGTPRWAIYDAIARIREVFRAARLHEYLRDPRHFERGSGTRGEGPKAGPRGGEI